MLLARKFSMALLAAAALEPGASREIAPRGEEPALIELQPGSTLYRTAGDFTRAGKPAEAPLTTIRSAQPLAVMKSQVTAADYQRCVAARGCKPLVDAD